MHVERKRCSHIAHKAVVSGRNVRSDSNGHQRAKFVAAIGVGRAQLCNWIICANNLVFELEQQILVLAQIAQQRVQNSALNPRNKAWGVDGNARCTESGAHHVVTQPLPVAQRDAVIAVQRLRQRQHRGQIEPDVQVRVRQDVQHGSLCSCSTEAVPCDVDLAVLVLVSQDIGQPGLNGWPDR